jgi:hypothetical protein
MQSDCPRPSFLLAIGQKSAHAGGIRPVIVENDVERRAAKPSRYLRFADCGLVFG